METGKERLALEGNFKANSVVFSPDSKILAASTSRGRVVLWDVATGKQRRSWDQHTEAVNSMAFSPDRRTLNSLGQDRQLVNCDTATSKERKSIEMGEDVMSQYGAVTPDGKTLAVMGGGWVRLFDLEQQAFWPDVAWNNQGGRQRCLAFSPVGKLLATGSGGHPATNSVYLYELPPAKDNLRK